MSKKLSPQEEALLQDRESNEIPVPTREQKKMQHQKQESLKVSRDNASVELLRKFVDFLADPLQYLKSQVSMGEWEGAKEKYELYSLLTQVKIQESLQDLVSLLKARK